MLKEKIFYRIAALGYLAIFILAIFANFLVFEVVYVAEDLVATATNIADAPLFRAGALAFLLVALVDIIVAWALYRVFLKRSPELSTLAMILRIGNALMLAVASVFFLLAIQDAFYLEIFHLLWMAALLLFGVHLWLLAALLWKHSKTQSALAVLLFIAGLAYILDTSALFLLDNYAAFADTALAAVAIPGVVGELGFTVWLFVKGFAQK